MPRIPRRKRSSEPQSPATPQTPSSSGGGQDVPAPDPVEGVRPLGPVDEGEVPPDAGRGPGAGGDWLPADEPAPFEEASAPPTSAPPADEAPTAHDAPAAHEGPTGQHEPEEEEPDTSRVSVVSEPGPEGEGDEFQWHTGTQRATGAPDAIEFVDVHKAFGRNKILRGLNMGIPEEKISMILGPSGTGKSVCIKHMVGLLYPDDGDVIVHGESVPSMADDELFAMRKKFGVLFQDGALFGSMNLYDNVAFPLRQHTDKGENEIADICNRRLREVGLADAGEKMPNELSGGMRKRAGFARALVLDPDIVLFDEPDSGLDPVRTALLGELIQEIHHDMMEDFRRRGKPHLPAFCLITHDIATARRVAEHISVLWKGRIVES